MCRGRLKAALIPTRRIDVEPQIAGNNRRELGISSPISPIFPPTGDGTSPPNPADGFVVYRWEGSGCKPLGGDRLLRLAGLIFGGIGFLPLLGPLKRLVPSSTEIGHHLCIHRRGKAPIDLPL